MSVGTFAKLSLPPGDHVLHVCDTDAALDARFATRAGQSVFLAASLEGARKVDQGLGRRAVVTSRLGRVYDWADAYAAFWMPWM